MGQACWLAFRLGELAGCDDSVGMRVSVEHRGGFSLTFFALIAIAGIEWGTVCVGQALRAVLDASREGKHFLPSSKIRLGAVEFS
jgi:hypothetical protein